MATAYVKGLGMILTCKSKYVAKTALTYSL